MLNFIDAYFEGRWMKWLIPLVVGILIGFYFTAGESKCYTYNGGLIEKPCD